MLYLSFHFRITLLSFSSCVFELRTQFLAASYTFIDVLYVLMTRRRQQERERSLDRKASKAAYSFSSYNTWNDTFLAETVCNAINSETDSFYWYHYADYPLNGVSTILTLPSCFWSIASGITDLTAISSVPGHIIFRGNNETGSEHDPLAAFSLGLSSLRLDGVYLVDPITRNGLSSDGYSSKLAEFLQKRPALYYFEIENARLRGSLPSNMSASTALERIYLSHNRLSGSLPRILPPNILTFMVVNNTFTGSLPSTLPASIRRASLSYNSLSGGIPSTIFNALEYEDVTFEFDHNSLSGAIPRTLFSKLKPSVDYEFDLDLSYNRLTALPADLLSNSSNIRRVTYLTLNLANNQIGGTFPRSFFNGSYSTYSISIYLHSNRLSGSIPSTLFSGLSSSDLEYIEFSAGSNELSGSVPRFFDHLTHLGNIYSLDFNFTSNRLSGTLPPALVPPSSSYDDLRYVYWRLGSNSLTGSIPSTLLARTGTFYRIDIDLSRNSLTGTIPSDLFENTGGIYGTPVTLSLASNKLRGPLTAPGPMEGIDSLNLDLSSNNFAGSIPADYFTAYKAGRSRSVTLSMDRCGLTGSVPNVPSGIDLSLDNNQLTSFSLSYTIANIGTYSSTISIQNNRLTGTLTIPASSESQNLYLYLSKNRLSELIVNTPSNYLRQLAIGENPNMVGSLPSRYFTNSSRVQLLIANHTKLSGDFPVVSYRLASSLHTLDLSHTSINFCVENIEAWNSSSLTNCNLKNTNATQCAQYYPAQCFVSSSANVSGMPSQPMMILAFVIVGVLALLF